MISPDNGERFAHRFGSAPTLLVRAPGRVNLIGEHVDYAGFPVLPMAIDRGITLLVRPRDDDRVTIANEDPRSGERSFSISVEIEPFAAGDWGNYPKAAVQGLAREGRSTRGFDALLASDLPAAAGLSSSSALVVATALAGLDRSDGAAIDRLGLARLLADAEHYVGARGGGMDQAAILCGRAGHALHVRFDPLRVRGVPLPADWRFVIAHSLEAAPKSAGARDAYNARRASVERALAGPAEFGSGLAPEDGRRLRHVLSERERVEGAVAAMETGDAAAFGGLMLASHASLRDDFDVSTPALDALVEAAMSSGAAGARLTGAGLGGCVVALADGDGEKVLLRGLERRFYAPRGVTSSPGLLFVARSADGASVASFPAGPACAQGPAGR